MSLTIEQLGDLQSPFYRVALKAIIFDEQRRLLLALNGKHQKWELPGGGWEHGETIEACLQREFNEELGVGITDVSTPFLAFQGVNRHGWHVVRILVRAALPDTNFHPADNIIDAKFFTKEALLRLEFVPEDIGVKAIVDQIW